MTEEAKTISADQKIEQIKGCIGKAQKFYSEEQWDKSATTCEETVCLILKTLCDNAGVEVNPSFIHDSAELWEEVVGKTKFDINKFSNKLSHISQSLFTISQQNSYKSLTYLIEFYSFVESWLNVSYPTESRGMKKSNSWN